MSTEDPKHDANLNNSDPETTGPKGEGVASKVFGYLPTVLVFAALGGIAVWGHRTGWQAPKFAEVAGSKSAGEKEDWCTEHGVPDSRCIKCHPELVGASAKDWCPEHGVAESKCTICHPEILKTGVAGDWCIEHSVPESGCTLCHPEIITKGTLPASLTGATVTMVPGAEQTTVTPAAKDPQQAATQATTMAASEETGEKAAKDPKTCQTHNMRVQFASAASLTKAGVRLGQVVERPMSASLTANAEVQYSRNRYAQVSSAVAGKVWRVEKEIGQPVKKGEVVALIDAAEVGRLKAEFLQAAADVELKSKTLKRLKASSESGFRTEAELQEAEAEMKSSNIRAFNARQGLVNLGLSDHVEDMSTAPERRNVQFMGLPRALADSLDPKTTTANLLPLIAPFDGTVIERNVVAGEVIEPSKPLFVVADTTQMWVTADVPLAEAKRIKVGQKFTFRPDGAADDEATGAITWISTAVDDQTRTVKVRADVANPESRLLAYTFGKAYITIREVPSAIAVPAEAVQWEGCCNVAFVRLTDDIFQTRKVKLGAKVNGFTEVLVGLAPGEVVATTGSHVLKSEILKSALGAGCTDGH